MTPRRYGPLAYLPITRRPKLTWPGGARVALWVNPNIEFFGLDDVMPGNLNERVPREHAKVPNVRNWRCGITATGSASGGSWRC
jgi:allantoinase